MFKNLAPLLWHSFAQFLSYSIYPTLSPPNVTSAASNRVCNVLTLLQQLRKRCMFKNLPQLLWHSFAQFPSYCNGCSNLPCTLTSKCGSSCIELSLQCPHTFPAEESGSGNKAHFLRELRSWKVDTFIVQKVLLDDVGLGYVCATPERFFEMGWALANMLILLTSHPSTRLLKFIIRCFLRLIDNPRTSVPLIFSCLFLACGVMGHSRTVSRMNLQQNRVSNN